MPSNQPFVSDYASEQEERFLAEARAEIEAIATDPAEPSFDNTVAALERAGARLDRVARAFFTLAGAHTDDTIEAVFCATDAPSHARHAIEVLKHGKHVSSAVPAVRVNTTRITRPTVKFGRRSSWVPSALAPPATRRTRSMPRSSAGRHRGSPSLPGGTATTSPCT